MIIEHKALSALIEADEATGVITGIASAPAVDREGDSFAPDAFDFELPVPMLYGHDQREVIGKWTDVEATPAGLMVEGQLNLETARGRDIYALLKSGDLRGLSVGFVPKVASETRTGRRITKADLLEISIVAIPANAEARVLSVKGISMSEVESLASRIEALEVAAARPAIATKAAPGIETKAIDRLLRGETVEIEGKALSIAGTGVGANATGANLVPADYRAQVIERIVEYSPIRDLATVISTAGGTLEYPVLADEIVPAAVAELGTRTEDEPTFTKLEIKAFEQAVIVPVSQQLLEDSAVDLSGFITNHLGRKFGQLEGKWFTVGVGTTEPLGVAAHTGINSVTTKTKSVLSFDDVIAAYHGIKGAYASRGSWLANRKTIAALRSVKDGQGRYLWEPSIAPGQPGTIYGRPVYEAPDLADIADAAVPLIFGDFSNFLVADRIALQITLDNLTGAAGGIHKFIARRRLGGAVTLPEAFVKVVVKDT